LDAALFSLPVHLDTVGFASSKHGQAKPQKPRTRGAVT
jgi:hypothetical protein